VKPNVLCCEVYSFLYCSTYHSDSCTCSFMRRITVVSPATVAAPTVDVAADVFVTMRYPHDASVDINGFRGASAPELCGMKSFTLCVITTDASTIAQW